MNEEDFFNLKSKEKKSAIIQKERQEELARIEEERLRLEEEKDKKKTKKTVHDQLPNNDDERKTEAAKSQAGKSSASKSKSKTPKKEVELEPKVLCEQKIGKDYFLVPDDAPKKEVRSYQIKKEKQIQEEEDNKVRRWRVFINEIRMENLQKEELSVFLNFRIGQLNKNALRHKDVSSDEVFFKSEICKDLKRSEVKVIKVMFEAEMNLSYQMLKERLFVIEIWEYRRFRLNLFLGKIQVSLLSIASGNIKRQDDIKKAFGERRQFARIHYNILFQEIWDYKITFEAWKGMNIVAEGKDKNKHDSDTEDDEDIDYDPKLELTLMTEEFIKPSVQSVVIKKTKNPNFRNLKGFMHFRGTMEELTQLMMRVSLYKNEFFILEEKLASLRGIQDTNYLKTIFRLQLKFPPKKIKWDDDNKRKTAKKKKKQFDPDNSQDEDDDDALQDESYYAQIEGRVNLNKVPRYAQNGELNRYIPEEHYLVVTVNRLNSVLSPDDRGVINTFLTVAWRDQAKTTRVIRNDPNPTYNEELYFRIPILKKSSLGLGGLGDLKSDEELIADAIKEELRTRPDITIQLWLDGQDILSDESLGYCRVFLSEIGKVKNPVKKTLTTDDNMKFSFDTREATFTKKFESGLFNVGHIQITFQIFFAPDLSNLIELAQFCELPPEIYPYQIAEQLRVKYDHEENQQYQRWDKAIRDNFQQIGLEKTAYNIFFKNIFVHDQFNYYHLVCKYLEKFYIKYQSEEATAELFAKPEDIRMKSLEELVHFVRNIQFIQDSFSRSEIWRSPDFLLKVRKGFIHDHAILAACLFMGYEDEDIKYGNEKHYVPFEHRVFVALGTLKHNKAFHAWIMTYSWNFDSVTMWDVQEDFHQILKARVKPTQIAALRKFLYPERPPAKKNPNVFGNLTKLASGKEQVQISRKQQRKLDKKAKKEKERELKLEKLKKEQEELEAEQEEEKNRYLEQREKAQFLLDDVQNIEDQKVLLDEINNYGGTVKIKNERQKGTVQSTAKQTKHSSREKQTVKPMWQNPFVVDKFRETTKKEDPIKVQQQQEEEERKKNPIAKFSKKEDFYIQKDKKLVKLEEQDVWLPYCSLEILFNNKNIFANRGNQNPAEIFYHLHKKNDWEPFILERTKFKEDEDEEEEDPDELISDNDDDDDELMLLDGDAKPEFVTKTWNRKLGAFYSAQILKEPIKRNKIQNLLKDIFYSVQSGIEKARGKYSLFTSWKHQEDGLNKKMLQYLTILEYKTTNRPIKIIEKNRESKKWNEPIESYDYDYIISVWQEEVKLLLPLNFHLCILPMRFTYTESERIRSVIVENMGAFFLKKEKKIIFNLAGKIFNYPNRINCVRLILGYTYTQAADDIKQEDDQDEEEEEQPGQVEILNPDNNVLNGIDDENEEDEQLLKQQQQDD